MRTLLSSFVMLTLALAACEPRSTAAGPVPAPVVTTTPSATASSAPIASGPTSALPADAGTNVPAPTVTVKVDGLSLQRFAKVGGSTIAVLASTPPPFTSHVVFIDVTTAREVGRLQLGPPNDDLTARIAPLASGVVVAEQDPKALRLTWIDASRSITSRATVAALRSGAGSMRGFAAFDDRLVLVTEGAKSAAVMHILDAKGTELASHTCNGTVPPVIDAQPGRAGDYAVLVNLASRTPESGLVVVPICAGALHGPAKWRDGKMRGARAIIADGRVYRPDDAESTARAMDDELEPTGPSVPIDDLAPPTCKGKTGTATVQAERVGTKTVVSTIRCCGDSSPSGLFLCDATPPQTK